MGLLEAAIKDLEMVGDCRTCGNRDPFCDSNPDSCIGYKWRGAPPNATNGRKPEDGMDELYRDICEAVTYFRDAVRAAGGIIKESDPELAGPLTEQMSHFQTALAAMWIVKAWYETKCTPEKMKT